MIDIPNKIKSVLVKMGSENADQMTYNLLLIGGMTISIFALFESVLVGAHAAHILLIGAAWIMFTVTFLFINVLHKMRLAAVFALVTVIFILFPAMFMTCGGLQGGMIFWMAVGIICTFLLGNGKNALR